MFKTWDGKLYKGSHSEGEGKGCIMEVVSWIAGEPHSDHPDCVCPVIAAFLRSWNDGIGDDARRRELLGPFVFRLPGTRATPEIETQRAFLCLDWLIRVNAASFMQLVPELKEHSKRLVELPPIVDQRCLEYSAAAWAAATDAASWAAAWDAARAASTDAASTAAAWDALSSTVERLQESAVDLVNRMIRLTEPQEDCCEKEAAAIERPL